MIVAGRLFIDWFSLLAPNINRRTIYAKCEYFNPLSSVKDRLALAIIEAAEKDGSLKPGQTVVEATSGNTGIAVAMMCAQRGYPCVITMAEPFSVERRKLMRMLGAKVRNDWEIGRPKLIELHAGRPRQFGKSSHEEWS